MPQDPKTVVRGSSMLWSQQVAIVDDMDAMDSGIETLEAQREKRQPVIYPFNRGGRKGFVAKLNPYE